MGKNVAWRVRLRVAILWRLMGIPPSDYVDRMCCDVVAPRNLDSGCMALVVSFAVQLAVVFPAKCGGSNYVLNLPVLHHSGVMVHLHDGHREQPCEECEQDASKEVRLSSDPAFPSEEVEHLSHADDESDRTQTKSARPCRKYRCPRRIVDIRLGYRKSDVRCSGQLERR